MPTGCQSFRFSTIATHDPKASRVRKGDLALTNGWIAQQETAVVPRFRYAGARRDDDQYRQGGGGSGLQARDEMSWKVRIN